MTPAQIAAAAMAAGAVSGVAQAVAGRMMAGQPGLGKNQGPADEQTERQQQQESRVNPVASIGSGMFFLSAGLIVAVTSERLKHRHTKLIALGEQRCITVDMDKGGDVRAANEGKLVHVVAPLHAYEQADEPPYIY
jgi:hypothetical protein